jgi:hypothetical protein
MLHNLGSLGALIDQLTRCHNTNRAVRDEVSPHPMVMSDCGGCIEMGPIVQCVTVANNNDVVISDAKFCDVRRTSAFE